MSPEALAVLERAFRSAYPAGWVVEVQGDDVSIVERWNEQPPADLIDVVGTYRAEFVELARRAEAVLRAGPAGPLQDLVGRGPAPAKPVTAGSLGGLQDLQDLFPSSTREERRSPDYMPAYIGDPGIGPAGPAEATETQERRPSDVQDLSGQGPAEVQQVLHPPAWAAPTRLPILTLYTDRLGEECESWLLPAEALELEEVRRLSARLMPLPWPSPWCRVDAPLGTVPASLVASLSLPFLELLELPGPELLETQERAFSARLERSGPKGPKRVRGPTGSA